MLQERQLTWDGFDQLAKGIVRQIQESQAHYDAILAIARGGVILAGYLAYHLNIKPFYIVNARAYDDQEIIRPEVLYFPENVDFGHVLVVDDILDSGTTYELLDPHIKRVSKHDAWAVLMDKGKTNISPDYVGLRVEPSKWVHFPWNC